MDASFLRPAQYFHNLSMASLWNGMMESRAGHSRSASSSGGGNWDEIRFTFVPFLLGNVFVLLTRSPVQHCKKDAAGRGQVSFLPWERAKAILAS